MSDPIQITNDTTLLISVGSLIATGGALGKMIYNYARLELKQEVMTEQLNSYFQQLRDLRAEIKEIKKP